MLFFSLFIDIIITFIYVVICLESGFLQLGPTKITHFHPSPILTGDKFRDFSMHSQIKMAHCKNTRYDTLRWVISDSDKLKTNTLVHWTCMIVLQARVAHHLGPVIF